MTTVVYTDGACSGNPGPGGWAWAVPGGEYMSGAAERTTNQRMEVQAVLEALRRLDGPVEVVSDSTYVVNCFRDRWWEGWIRRGWTNSQRKPVANRDLWEPLVEIVRERASEISFRWVKGHSGDQMNDLVDVLAVEAAKSQKDSRGEVTSRPGGADSPTDDSAATQGHRIVVTGHKPPAIGGYDSNPIADRIRTTLAEILVAKAQLHSDSVVLSGMGLGVEQLAAEAAVAANVPFVAVLPYPEADANWPDSSRRHFRSLIDQATGEILLQQKTPDSKQAAGAALNRQIAWLVRHADEAVVVFDGIDPHLGRTVRSLEDHVGEMNVWTVPVDQQST